MIASVGLDHVQVAAPAGCEEAAREFYAGLLGLTEIDKPPALRSRGGVWFALDAAQLHIGVDPNFTPAAKAHPALSVTPTSLEQLAARLTGAGMHIVWDTAIPRQRRFFCADPWGNRLEVLARTDELWVEEDGRELAFSFEQVVRYNGGGSPGGVAHAFKVLELAGYLLHPGATPPRRELTIRTAFGGPGARDAIELVTRAVTDGRFTVDPDLTRPDIGPERERFVWDVGLRGRTVRLVLRDGFVSSDFIELAGRRQRSEDDENRLTRLKAQMAERLMAASAEDVYESVAG